jgi:hypothetical protein
MKRFFAALKTENLMAAELLAVHENFNGGDVDYQRTFGKLINDDDNPLSLATFEWLLTFAKGCNIGFFRPGNEYTYRRRSSNTNNWRGHVCDMVRRWMHKPSDLTDEQKRIARLTYDLGWLLPDTDLRDTEAGREWLKETAPPDRLLEIALAERTRYERGKPVTDPVCMPLINWLIDKGPLDLSRCGNELVREYHREDRTLALRLIRHRDPAQKMPKQFTDLIQEVLQKYKLYQKLQQDMPTLLGAKTHESDDNHEPEPDNE